MIDGHSEQLKSMKKAMKVHEIASSDKEEFIECKNDLMKKIAMDEGGADEVANSIRDMFLPKLLESVGLDPADMPFDLSVKTTEKDDNFATEPQTDFHGDTESYSLDEESPIDDSGVDGNEIATIHITVPADKIRDVEQALENVLGDTDAISKDHAIDHKDNNENDNDTGEKDMTKKELEARAALRKTLLAAASDNDEVKSVTRVDKFDHDKSEQYKEEDFYNTKKGDMTDPEHSTLDFAENKIPNFTKLVDDHLSPDLGLHDTLTAVSFDGTPDADQDGSDYSLDFDELEIPSQGDKELFGEFEFPSENKQPHKHTVISSTAKLGEFDADAAEEILAMALRTAGVKDEDLGQLTYAEALELYKAIKTADKMEREHYGKDGKMVDDFNDPKSPDENGRTAVTEDSLIDHKGTKEEDPESGHTRKELYSSTSTEEAYASMLRKLMRTSSEGSDTYNEYPEKVDKFDKGAKSDKSDRESEGTEINGDGDIEINSQSEELAKSAELYKARLKTAYAMSSKLTMAGLLPPSDLDAYAEGMLNDGLTVTAMIRQTKLMVNSAAANAERFAAGNASEAVRKTVAGVGYNPSLRTSGTTSDMSGAVEIQNALKNIGWTQPEVVNGMED